MRLLLLVPATVRAMTRYRSLYRVKRRVITVSSVTREFYGNVSRFFHPTTITRRLHLMVNRSRRCRSYAHSNTRVNVNTLFLAVHFSEHDFVTVQLASDILHRNAVWVTSNHTAHGGHEDEKKHACLSHLAELRCCVSELRCCVSELRCCVSELRRCVSDFCCFVSRFRQVLLGLLRL